MDGLPEIRRRILEIKIELAVHDKLIKELRETVKNLRNERQELVKQESLLIESKKSVETGQ